MDGILRWIASPDVQDWYLAFAVAVMLVPALAMSRWYQGRIRQTEGGRALMEEQNSHQPEPGGGLGDAVGDIQEGVRLHRDIMDGRYGPDAVAVQRRVYVFVALWFVAVFVVFGLLLWAQEYAKAAS
jgi:hypothetical protein